jgi:hypothetical protein
LSSYRLIQKESKSDNRNSADTAPQSTERVRGAGWAHLSEVYPQGLGSGVPLGQSSPVEAESRFDYDFGGVRIHADEAAARSARELSARAYTVGQHVVFGAGEYRPGTAEGQKLIAHELAHVIQQSRGAAGISSSSHYDRLEQNAESAARAAASNSYSIQVRGSSPPQVARAWDPRQRATATPSVLALGLYQRPFPGGRVLPAQELLMTEAKTATGLRPILMGGMEESFQQTWRALAPSGLASGTLTYEALEGTGAYGISAIYFNVEGVSLSKRFGSHTTTAEMVEFPEGTFQTGAELRSVVAAMAAGQHKVDLYIKHSGGLSIVRAGHQTVEGAPLPAEWRAHLPPSFETRPPGSGGGSSGSRGGFGPGSSEKEGAPPSTKRPGRLQPRAPIRTDGPPKLLSEPQIEIGGGGRGMPTPPTTTLPPPQQRLRTAKTVQAPTGPPEQLTATTQAERLLEPQIETGGEGRGAVEGLGIMIYQAEAGIIAQNEATKAQAEIDSLAPRIHSLRQGGEWVGVWVLFSEPENVDIGPFPTPDQARVFQGIALTHREKESKARMPPTDVIGGGPGRNLVRHLLSVLAPTGTPEARTSTTSRLQSQPSGPKSPADLDSRIDTWIASRDWTDVALTLNGFSTDDINRRVGSDPRLTGHLSKLMEGAIEGMILWPPPNRVADAISKADPDAARAGRINFIHDYPHSFLKVAIVLNGLSDDDIRRELPRDIDLLKPMRTAAKQAGWLGRIVRFIDERHAFIPDEE